MIWGQCNIDIFLIDWERPSTAQQQPTNQIAGHQPPVGGVVSIWRTYFVANEWNELQTLRRGLRPLSTLIVGLLFLQVMICLVTLLLVQSCVGVILTMNNLTHT